MKIMQRSGSCEIGCKAWSKQETSCVLGYPSEKYFMIFRTIRGHFFCPLSRCPRPKTKTELAECQANPEKWFYKEDA